MLNVTTLWKSCCRLSAGMACMVVRALRMVVRAQPYEVTTEQFAHHCVGATYHMPACALAHSAVVDANAPTNGEQHINIQDKRELRNPYSQLRQQDCFVTTGMAAAAARLQ